MIEFHEDTHTYINTENNKKYISVSTLLGLYKPKFDSDNISRAVAKKEGVSQQVILERWKETTEYACERGTAFHLALENNIKYGEVDPNYKKVIEHFQLIIPKEIPKILKVHSEIMVYNHEYEVAGMSDLCWDTPKNTFIIGDFKTNKAFNFDSKYNNWYKYPLEHLEECHFNTYALQMSIYAYLHELMTGKKCKAIMLLWLNGKTGKWDIIHCNYLKYEVIMLLKNYKKNYLK